MVAVYAIQYGLNRTTTNTMTRTTDAMFRRVYHPKTYGRMNRRLVFVLTLLLTELTHGHALGVVQCFPMARPSCVIVSRRIQMKVSAERMHVNMILRHCMELYHR